MPPQTKFGCYLGTNIDVEEPAEASEGFGYLLEPFRDPKGPICQTYGLMMIFLMMLLLLKVILLIWFWMILNVVWKVISGSEADDPRSDDEEEVEQLDEKIQFFKLAPVEEEVGVEDLHLSGRRSSPAKSFKKSSSTASGVSLPHDRKELLGRIGCDKQS